MFAVRVMLTGALLHCTHRRGYRSRFLVWFKRSAAIGMMIGGGLEWQRDGDRALKLGDVVTQRLNIAGPVSSQKWPATGTYARSL
jgi:hypothetical protein